MLYQKGSYLTKNIEDETQRNIDKSYEEMNKFLESNELKKYIKEQIIPCVDFNIKKAYENNFRNCTKKGGIFSPRRYKIEVQLNQVIDIDYKNNKLFFYSYGSDGYYSNHYTGNNDLNINFVSRDQCSEFFQELNKLLNKYELTCEEQISRDRFGSSYYKFIICAWIEP